MNKENVLFDITNSNSSGRIFKKRMRDGSLKVYNASRKIRKNVEFSFDTDASKLSFESKLEKVKDVMKSSSVSESLVKLMDMCLDGLNENDSTKNTQYNPYVENDSFICTEGQIEDLIQVANRHGHLEVVDFNRIGHVGQAVLKSKQTHIPIHWSSSPPLKDNFLVNFRMVHAYLCSGLLPVQYEKICDFSVIGKTSKRFREHFYTLYAECVKDTLNSSIENALEEEIRLDNGEKFVDILTDARHACRKNSFHTDVTALGQTTHKVISYQHITKEEESCSQKHELVGTKKIYEEFDSKNIKIKVHSHDRNSSVSKFITTENPETVDSYDTWHAAKEVRKVM